MADIDLPKKLTLFQRLSSTAYEDTVRRANEALAEATLKLETLKAREEEIKKREDEIKNREEESRRREKSVQEGEMKLVFAERAEARKKMEEQRRQILAKREALDREESETRSEADAQRTEEAFKEEEKIPETIPDESFKRDQVIMKALETIGEIAEKMKQQQDLRKGISETDAEKQARNLEIAKLKARLIGVVAVYRDLLPDDEIDSFVVNGKSCSVFLKEQVEDIIDLTKEDKGEKIHVSITGDKPNTDIKPNVPISDSYVSINAEVMKIAGDTYEQIARDQLGVRADIAYKGASYYPFESHLGLGDSRSTHYTIFRHIMQEKRRVLTLDDKKMVYDDMGYPHFKSDGGRGIAGKPRSSTSVAEKSKAEQKIDEVSGVIGNITDAAGAGSGSSKGEDEEHDM